MTTHNTRMLADDFSAMPLLCRFGPRFVRDWLHAGSMGDAKIIPSAPQSLRTTARYAFHDTRRILAGEAFGLPPGRLPAGIF